jgi:hypothetical protein
MAGTPLKKLITTAPDSDQRATQGTVNTILAELDTVITQLNLLRSLGRTRALGNPGFQRVSNFDVNNANAISYVLDGTLKSLAATQTFDTGTAQIIAADKWSSALLSLSAAGSPTVTWSATLNANTEAAAIAALPAIPSGHIALGYITVLTGSGVTWTAGTDALQSGTGGTPATTTNYYNTDQVGAQALGAAHAASAASQLQTLAGVTVTV